MVMGPARPQASSETSGWYAIVGGLSALVAANVAILAKMANGN